MGWLLEVLKVRSELTDNQTLPLRRATIRSYSFVHGEYLAALPNLTCMERERKIQLAYTFSQGALGFCSFLIALTELCRFPNTEGRPILGLPPISLSPSYLTYLVGYNPHQTGYFSVPSSLVAATRISVRNVHSTSGPHPPSLPRDTRLNHRRWKVA